MPGRARALAGLAVVVSGGLAAGAGYALHDATKDGGTTTALPAASAEPTPEVTAEPTPTPTPSATPSPTPSPTASPTPRATATTAPTPTATPSAAAVTRYPYPGPTRGYTSLYVESAEVDPANDGRHGVTLKAHAADGDGTILVTSIDWGDGTKSGGEPDPSSCPPHPSPTAKPGPYQPEPSDRTITATHRYKTAGSYDVVLSVRSINADCRPHGPATERATASFTGPNAVVVS